MTLPEKLKTAIERVKTHSPDITLSDLACVAEAAESTLNIGYLPPLASDYEQTIKQLQDALDVAEKALQVAEKHMTLEDMLLPECPELGSALDVVRKALSNIKSARGGA